MFRRVLGPVLILLCFGALAAGCGDNSTANEDGDGSAAEGRSTFISGSPAEPKIPPFPKGKPPRKLIVKDLQPGTGVEAEDGDLLTTKFVAVTIDGEPFESTWDRGFQPFSFHLGEDEASPAFERGLQGMRVGGRRELIVPGEIASKYTALPHEESFVYVIELIGVQPPELDDRTEPKVVVPPGKPPKQLRVRDLIEGSGPAARSGDIVTMQYNSRHYSGKFWSKSWDDPHPFRIKLGADTFKSIPGWEEGIPGMRVGGRREIIVPPAWIYQGGAKPDSVPSETLVYIIDLFGITEPRQQSG